MVDPAQTEANWAVQSGCTLFMHIYQNIYGEYEILCKDFQTIECYASKPVIYSQTCVSGHLY